MSPDVALQKALLARLAGTADVTALVGVSAIIDGQAIPSRFPSILFGDGQVVREPITVAARHRRIYVTLHVWAKTMPQAREIAGAVTSAVEHEPLALAGGHRAVSTVIAAARFMRDPDGEDCHGVVTVDCLAEVAA